MVLLAKTAQLGEEKKAIRRIMDKLAPIYETKVWAPLIWRLFGGLSVPSYWRMAEIVAEKTEIKEGCSALDVATGSGVTARKLGKLAGEEGNVCGLDVSLKVLQDAVKRTRKEGLTNITFMQGDAEELPFKDQSFDAVTCTFAFHAIPNPGKSLREMSRVLKPHGKISMITASIPSFLPEWIKRSSLARERHLHHRHFEAEELREMLERNELMGTKAKSYGAFLLVEARKIKPHKPPHLSAPL